MIIVESISNSNYNKENNERENFNNSKAEHHQSLEESYLRGNVEGIQSTPPPAPPLPSSNKMYLNAPSSFPSSSTSTSSSTSPTTSSSPAHSNGLAQHTDNDIQNSSNSPTTSGSHQYENTVNVNFGNGQATKGSGAIDRILNNLSLSQAKQSSQAKRISCASSHSPTNSGLPGGSQSMRNIYEASTNPKSTHATSATGYSGTVTKSVVSAAHNKFLMNNTDLNYNLQMALKAATAALQKSKITASTSSGNPNVDGVNLAMTKISGSQTNLESTGNSSAILKNDISAAKSNLRKTSDHYMNHPSSSGNLVSLSMAGSATSILTGSTSGSGFQPYVRPPKANNMSSLGSTDLSTSNSNQQSTTTGSTSSTSSSPSAGSSQDIESKTYKNTLSLMLDNGATKSQLLQQQSRNSLVLSQDEQAQKRNSTCSRKSVSIISNNDTIEEPQSKMSVLSTNRKTSSTLVGSVDASNYDNINNIHANLNGNNDDEYVEEVHVELVPIIGNLTSAAPASVNFMLDQTKEKKSDDNQNNTAKSRLSTDSNASTTLIGSKTSAQIGSALGSSDAGKNFRSHLGPNVMNESLKNELLSKVGSLTNLNQIEDRRKSSDSSIKSNISKVDDSKSSVSSIPPPPPLPPPIPDFSSFPLKKSIDQAQEEAKKKKVLGKALPNAMASSQSNWTNINSFLKSAFSTLSLNSNSNSDKFYANGLVSKLSHLNGKQNNSTKSISSGTSSSYKSTKSADSRKQTNFGGIIQSAYSQMNLSTSSYLTQDSQSKSNSSGSKKSKSPSPELEKRKSIENSEPRRLSTSKSSVVLNKSSVNSIIHESPSGSANEKKQEPVTEIVTLGSRRQKSISTDNLAAAAAAAAAAADAAVIMSNKAKNSTIDEDANESKSSVDPVSSTRTGFTGGGSNSAFKSSAGGFNFNSFKPGSTLLNGIGMSTSSFAINTAGVTTNRTQQTGFQFNRKSSTTLNTDENEDQFDENERRNPFYNQSIGNMGGSTYNLSKFQATSAHLSSSTTNLSTSITSKLPPPPHIQPFSGVLSKSLFSVVVKPQPVKPIVEPPKLIPSGSSIKSPIQSPPPLTRPSNIEDGCEENAQSYDKDRKDSVSNPFKIGSSTMMFQSLDSESLFSNIHPQKSRSKSSSKQMVNINFQINNSNLNNQQRLSLNKAKLMNQANNVVLNPNRKFGINISVRQENEDGLPNEPGVDEHEHPPDHEGIPVYARASEMDQNLQQSNYNDFSVGDIQSSLGECIRGSNGGPPNESEKCSRINELEEKLKLKTSEINLLRQRLYSTIEQHETFRKERHLKLEELEEEKQIYEQKLNSMRAHFNQQLSMFESSERQSMQEKFNNLQKVYSDLKMNYQKNLENELRQLKAKLNESQTYASQLIQQFQIQQQQQLQQQVCSCFSPTGLKQTNTVGVQTPASLCDSFGLGFGASSNPQMYSSLNQLNMTGSMTNKENTDFVSMAKKLKSENNELRFQLDAERKHFQMEKEKWQSERAKVLQFQRFLQNQRNSVNALPTSNSNGPYGHHILYSSNSASPVKDNSYESPTASLTVSKLKASSKNSSSSNDSAQMMNSMHQHNVYSSHQHLHHGHGHVHSHHMHKQQQQQQYKMQQQQQSMTPTNQLGQSQHQNFL